MPTPARGLAGGPEERADVGVGPYKGLLWQALFAGGHKGRPRAGFPLHFRVCTPPQGRTGCRGVCPPPPAGWPGAREGRADVGVGPYKGLLWQELFAGGHKGRPYR